MWNPEKVERALFTWRNWRKSVIDEWMSPTARLDKLRLNQLREIAANRMSEMEFPKSVVLEMYWYCCVLNDYSIDSWSTFNRIVVPAWLPSVYDPILNYELKPGDRMYPPFIIGEGDLALRHRQLFGTYTKKPDYSLIPGEKEDIVFLRSGHEFYPFLNEFKGRTRRRKPPGRYPTHSDRMAVICYRLNLHGATYLKIAKKFKLPIENCITFERSTAAMHLVGRGKKLAREAEERRLSPLPQVFEKEDSG
jgi:hypothetical protein